MQLTSTDETNLLIPLHAGMHDEQAWRTFVERVQRRTGADYVSLIFAQGDTPIHLSTEIFSGRNLRAEARRLGLDGFFVADRLAYDRLRPGRVYHLAELVEGDPDMREFHQRFHRELGLGDGRIIRIREQEGTSAWLMLASADVSFSAAAGALLVALAPHVEVALRNFVLTERQRIRAAAGSEGLARAGVGWIALGRDTRIIDIDPNLEPLLREMTGANSLIGHRLQARTASAREILAQAASVFADHPGASPRALALQEQPRVEALLVPITERPEAALAIPVMLAFCRIDRTVGNDRRSILTDLFGLSSREAELALAMSEGSTIFEAAAAMGLTNETVRGYSKRIYAKMGVRGQAELVRRIFMSSANLG